MAYLLWFLLQLQYVTVVSYFVLSVAVDLESQCQYQDNNMMLSLQHSSNHGNIGA